jgi:hypothetical protein
MRIIKVTGPESFEVDNDHVSQCRNHAMLMARGQVEVLLNELHVENLDLVSVEDASDLAIFLALHRALLKDYRQHRDDDEPNK